ncbi:A-agglutinin anchorage subunit-like [Sinocyclocheilus grahami]|uniref:A-agglutinin anchorage subunit-like n=1 Tax=Sinocyclocheilus grahami TaxID=75366 RepID=UPI0007AD3061|nr:PREDICTED: A-agglutinin anchorage subunit-like [Sinocyclocheilus grahami]
MKVSGAHSWLLLLFLVQSDRSQVSGQCSVPTALVCCPGKNSQCISGGCFCDEFCIINRDCCADYNQTCIQPLISTSPPSSSSLPTTNQSPTSSPTSHPSSSILPTSNRSSSPTSEPPSSSSPPPTSASLSTSQQRKNISAITVLHMRVHSGASEEAMLKAVWDFILHLEGLMRRQQCEDCSLRVLNISQKYH